ILALGASPAYAKPRKHKKTRALSAAKAALAVELPGKGEPPPEVLKGPKPSYWLAADPHVPLAMVQGRAIRSGGKRRPECGEMVRWANPRSRWHAVDAWGQTTGLFEVNGSETFDVTACREVSFSARSGKPGVGLFVSDDSGYTPGASVAFAASAVEK